MKFVKIIAITLIVFTSSLVNGQSDSTKLFKRHFLVPKLTTEIGVGINASELTGVIFSNLVQWNINRHLSIISYTSYAYNNAFVRKFNYVETNYDYTLSQKFGIGTSFYSKKSAHTISFLAGIKYEAFKETLNNPNFEKVSASASSLSPDFGIMYNFKRGQKKYFFNFKMYLPLYPYPFKTSDINAITANMNNFTIEVGLGVRLR